MKSWVLPFCLLIITFNTSFLLGADDPYELLKVPRNVSQEKIDEAFQKELAAAKKDNPDLVIKLRKAYQDLSNPSTKSQIDRRYEVARAPEVFAEQMAEQMADLRERYGLRTKGEDFTKNLYEMGKQESAREEKFLGLRRAAETERLRGVASPALTLLPSSLRYYAVKQLLMRSSKDFIASQPSPAEIREYVGFSTGQDFEEGGIPYPANEQAYLKQRRQLYDAAFNYCAAHSSETKQEYQADFGKWFVKVRLGNNDEAKSLELWFDRYTERYHTAPLELAQSHFDSSVGSSKVSSLELFAKVLPAADTISLIKEEIEANLSRNSYPQLERSISSYRSVVAAIAAKDPLAAEGIKKKGGWLGWLTSFSLSSKCDYWLGKLVPAEVPAGNP